MDIEADIDDLTTDYNNICEDIANIKNIFGELTTKLKNYKKKVDKLAKDNEKKEKVKVEKQEKVEKVEKVKKEPKEKKEPKPKKEKKVPIAPSGISSAASLSDELCVFLEKPTGTKLFRAEVTKIMYKYINDNHLQDIENKKVIRADDKMKKLLGLEDNQELTYFNIQGLMNKHYININDPEPEEEKQESDVNDN
jgi:upstream activation factor subunit UAF30